MSLSATLITSGNCNDLATELKLAYPHPNGYQPNYWIGYYLVQHETGSFELYTPVAFHASWEFVAPQGFTPIKQK